MASFTMWTLSPSLLISWTETVVLEIAKDVSYVQADDGGLCRRGACVNVRVGSSYARVRECLKSVCHALPQCDCECQVAVRETLNGIVRVVENHLQPGECRRESSFQRPS